MNFTTDYKTFHQMHDKNSSIALYPENCLIYLVSISMMCFVIVIYEDVLENAGATGDMKVSRKNGSQKTYLDGGPNQVR